MNILLRFRFLFFFVYASICWIAAADAASVQTNPNKVLEMTGKIYIQKDLHPTCKLVVQGYKCSQPAYGVFFATIEKAEDQNYSFASFADPTGVQVIEKSWTKNWQISKAILENKQQGFTTTLEVIDGNVYFTQEMKDGKVKKDHEKFPPNMVLPSTLIGYLMPKFDQVMKGEVVPVRMAVMDRRETIGFEIAKERMEKGPEGQDVLVLKMKPAAFIISQVVAPMYFFIDVKNNKILGFEGRSALAKKDGGKWKPLDVYTGYNLVLNKLDQPADSKSVSALNP